MKGNTLKQALYITICIGAICYIPYVNNLFEKILCVGTCFFGVSTVLTEVKGEK